MQYTSNDQLFLNEYLKRYKSYIDCSIYMNDYLENFNVLVNYAYELSNTKSKLHVFPKFSILRLMILTWNKEVLNKISTENNLLSQKIVNLYSSYLLKDLNKIAMPTYGDSSFLKVSGYNQEDADFDDLSVYSMSTNYSNTRGSISSSLASSSNSSSTNSKNGSSTPGNFIKTAIGLFKPVEEDETIERLIEG